MQALLEALKKVGEEAFSGTDNCYVLNDKNELTHLCINTHEAIDFDMIVENSTLHFLILISCNITAIPQSIDNLKQLIHLDLTANKLTKIPPSIAKLTNLLGLYLSDNPLMQDIINTEQPQVPCELIAAILNAQNKVNVC